MKLQSKTPVMKKSQLFNSFIVVAALFTAGCSVSFNNWEYRKAERAAKKSDYKAAVKHYSRVVVRNPESELALTSARKASRISLFQLKNFSKAVDFYRHVVKFSPDSNERRQAQKEIADITFEKQTDYKRAVEEYNRLLILKLPPEDFLDIKLRIAKAHYYQTEFFQAESEAQNALLRAEKGPRRFEIELFLANVFFNTKRMDKAIEAYKKLDQEYPELAAKEKVKMSLVVCYEETEQFKDAISMLETMKDGAADPEFLDLKIARLKERIMNLPGSRGLRK